MAEGKKYFKQVNSEVNVYKFKFMIYYVIKVVRHMFNYVYVDRQSVNEFKRVLSESSKDKRVVLLPLLQSYTDPFMLLYILFRYEIEIPFTFGNGNMFSTQFFDTLLKGSGYVHLDRSNNKNS